MDQKRKSRYAYLEGWLSIAGNTILFVVKYLAGTSTGSVALIADAWHTLSDSVSSVVVILGAKMSGKPADEKHPYGHGRFELIAAFIVGVLLCYVGVQFLLEAYDKWQVKEITTYNTFAIIAVVLSIAFKEGMAQFAFWSYRKTKMTMLKADGWHHRTDAISSLLILIGILFANKFWWIDSVLTALVALMILYAAYEIVSDAISNILGEKPDDESMQKIRSIIDEVAGADVKAHHFHMHQYGNHKELTFHIYLDGKMNVSEAHDITNKIEENIRKECSIESTIHVEPKEESV